MFPYHFVEMVLGWRASFPFPNSKLVAVRKFKKSEKGRCHKRDHKRAVHKFKNRICCGTAAVETLRNGSPEMFGKEISRWFWDLDHHENLPWKISAETLRTGLMPATWRALISGNNFEPLRRRRARVQQRGVRQGARPAPAAVLQVQGRGLLLQGVPGGRPGRPRCAQPERAVRVCSLTRARSLPPCLHPPATRLPRGRPGTSTSAVRRGRAQRRRSSGAPRREARN